MAKIEISNLSKVFKTELVETLALNGVSLKVEDGEFVAIMGPSGCGKSTLLNILGLLDTPSDGEYLLDGVKVSQKSESELSEIRTGKIGFVFQAFNLIDDLTVEENIEMPLTYMNIPDSECRRRIGEAMEQVSMSHRAKHFPAQLSGGQQQRAAIARAVAARPSIILADEPTGNLDSKNGQEVMELLKKLNDGGATIVMVTHSRRDAQYADRIVNLFDGQVVENVEL